MNSAEEPDTLTSRERLAAFLDEHEFTGSRRGDESELAEVRSMRPRLRDLLTGDRDDAAVLVNEALAEARAVPQLVRHGSHDWHIHAVSPAAPLETRILVEAAMAMIDVIRADESSRLALCADPDCNGVVLDLSRNRSRRFCSTACTNRAAVSAYRALALTGSPDIGTQIVRKLVYGAVMAIARFPAFVLDCPDPRALATFYGALLDWPVKADDGWADIRADYGDCISFQKVEGYVAPQWPGQDLPQQMHLDVVVDDLDEGETAVLALGATKHEHQPGTTFRVFLDPAGHPFCLCVS